MLKFRFIADIRDSGGHTPLHFAANEGNIEIVKVDGAG